MIPKAEIEQYLVPLSSVPTGLQPQGSLIGPIRSVLFDVYGTLFISGSGGIGALRRQDASDIRGLVARHGIVSPPSDLTGSFLSEIEAAHAHSRSQGVPYPEVEYDRIWMSVLGMQDRSQARRFAVEYELIVNPVYPMPGLLRMLEGCREKGLVLGLVSNAQFFTPWLFDWFFGKSPSDLGFDADLQIFSYREGCAKPCRLLFEKAAKRLAARGIEAGNVLYIGNDMRNDVVPAQRAGFQTALFAGDARSLRLRKEDRQCREKRPDLVITELMQVLELKVIGDET